MTKLLPHVRNAFHPFFPQTVKKKVHRVHLKPRCVTKLRQYLMSWDENVLQLKELSVLKIT